MRRERRGGEAASANVIVDHGKLYDFCQRRRNNTPSPTPIHRLPVSKDERKDGGGGGAVAGGPSSKKTNANTSGVAGGGHKVVIYFGDSLLHRGKQESNSSAAVAATAATRASATAASSHRTRAAVTTATTTTSSGCAKEYSHANRNKRSGDNIGDNRPNNNLATENDDKQRRNISNHEKSKAGREDSNGIGVGVAVSVAKEGEVTDEAEIEDEDVADDPLPSYIESIQNGVINIKIERNYRSANALVEKVARTVTTASTTSTTTTATTMTTTTTTTAATTTTPLKATINSKRAAKNATLSVPLAPINNRQRTTNNVDEGRMDEELDEGTETTMSTADEGTVIADSGDWSYVQQWRARHTRYLISCILFQEYSKTPTW